MSLHHPDSPEEFQALLTNAASEGKVTIVDFFTSWCGPCKRIAPDYKRLAEGNTDINFVKFQCDGDEDREEFSEEIGINCFPTFRFYWDGKECEEYRVRGSDLNKVEQYATHLHEELSTLRAEDIGLDPSRWGNDRATLRDNDEFVREVRNTGYRRIVYSPDKSWAEFLEDVRRS